MTVPIRLTDKLWIGCSHDVERIWESSVKFGATLNVAHDLRDPVPYPNIEHAQVGLVDGPGNELADYCASVICLKMLLRRYERVLVYDHNGTRALVVATMYLTLVGGQRRPDVSGWSRWPTWKESVRLTREVHKAHVQAHDSMPWGLLEVL